ncbi:hypothetical protein BS333_19735 [Vibrio azureus]|nr:hypothetical protein BS333_19735 [Vibrio azureus]
MAIKFQDKPDFIATQIRHRESLNALIDRKKPERSLRLWLQKLPVIKDVRNKTNSQLLVTPMSLNITDRRPNQKCNISAFIEGQSTCPFF